jgi:segregation and condensation protein A
MSENTAEARDISNETAPVTEAAAQALEAVPFATVKGQAVVDLPKDLYIPPDAMKVLLDAFEGPLDFLLYLIRKQNLDILDIPITDVTRQYMEYIDLMQNLSLELAAEYLVMAAILAEIKSRMLLPNIVNAENNEEDPRAELVRRLQEYERFKQAAENLDKIPRIERDTFTVENDSSQIAVEKPLPNVSMRDLMTVLAGIMRRVEHQAHHHIQLDALSVREKMTLVLSTIQGRDHVEFTTLFNMEEGRLGVVVTFLAMLELLKQGMIEFVQAAAFAPIYLTAKGGASKAEIADEGLSFT